MTYALTVPWPPSCNHYWRHARGRTYVSEAGTAYRRAVVALFRGRFKALKGRLHVVVKLYPPDKRRRDVDNSAKALLDALAHAGVYQDDSQIDLLTLERCERKPGGAVFVEIAEMSA